jgi:hypothetical protein
MRQFSCTKHFDFFECVANVLAHRADGIPRPRFNLCSRLGSNQVCPRVGARIIETHVRASEQTRLVGLVERGAISTRALGSQRSRRRCLAATRVQRIRIRSNGSREEGASRFCD